MIYIHRIWDNVPDDLKSRLVELAEELDAIEDIDARKAFISNKSQAWRDLREFLVCMSHYKCWYTEAKDSVSVYHIDHFRPHGRARQSETETADGYSWLAFDISNFRIAGALSNKANTEYSEEAVGKGDWFPLLDPAVRASLSARSTALESPMLLDPTDIHDPYMLIFNEDGRPAPVPGLGEHDTERVLTSIVRLGLKQDLLNRSRATAWKKCLRTILKYNRIVRKPKGHQTEEEKITAKECVEELLAMQRSDSEFSSVARCCLESNGLRQLIYRDELEPLSKIFA